MDKPYISIDELAELKGVHPDSIRRLLNSANPPVEFRHAYKTEGGKRGTWKIPRTEAMRWEPRSPGRYPKPKTHTP